MTTEQEAVRIWVIDRINDEEVPLDFIYDVGVGVVELELKGEIICGMDIENFINRIKRMLEIWGTSQ